MTISWYVNASLGGISLPGLLQATVTNTNTFAADTFQLTFAIGDILGSNLAFWADMTAGIIDIVALSDAGEQIDLLVGSIDTMLIDPVRLVAILEGRDLSGSLVDAYRQRDFVNQTASEVVATIANLHGLAAEVTPTSELVGRYYGDGYTKLSLGPFSRIRSDWDLIVQLARENRFDAFVQGRTLYFQPATQVVSSPVYLDVNSVESLRFQRTLGISQNISAHVQSWN